MGSSGSCPGLVMPKRGCLEPALVARSLGQWLASPSLSRLMPIQLPTIPAAMQQRSDSQSNLMISAMAGAFLGAAGLAWWLLSQAERRQELQRRVRSLRFAPELLESPADRPLPEGELQDRVQQLNQAIEDVRRQLESLSTAGPADR